VKQRGKNRHAELDCCRAEGRDAAGRVEGMLLHYEHVCSNCLHSLILQYQQWAGSHLHRDSRALKASYLQATKWLKLSIAKPLYCKNGDKKKEQETRKQKKDCTAAKTMFKYEPPKIYYNQSKKHTKQNIPMEMMSQL